MSFTTEKFWLKSRGMVGPVLSALVALGNLGYINMTQAQADQWQIVALSLIAVGSSFGVVGRAKATEKITFKLQGPNNEN